MVEVMRAEWGCTLPQAMFSESLSAAMVLWPALLSRHGAEVRFSYTDRARQAGKEAMRKRLAESFTIKDVPRA